MQRNSLRLATSIAQAEGRSVHVVAASPIPGPSYRTGSRGRHHCFACAHCPDLKDEPHLHPLGDLVEVELKSLTKVPDVVHVQCTVSACPHLPVAPPC